jgi:hypothetical protein
MNVVCTPKGLKAQHNSAQRNALGQEKHQPPTRALKGRYNYVGLSALWLSGTHYLGKQQFN